MRLRHIPGSEKVVGENPYVLSDPAAYRGKFSELFGSSRPIKIEIGCGKGRFITELSRKDPDTDYIGIERYSSVLLYALKRLEDISLPNLLFLCEDASLLDRIFAPGEVAAIYLNFPDPWPKDRHAKRRLLSPGFLKIYEDILPENGQLELKTDNEQLFDYSLDSLKRSGWKVMAYTRDLYSSDLCEGNVPTEYEIKFSGQGSPIYKLIAAAGKMKGDTDNGKDL